MNEEVSRVLTKQLPEYFRPIIEFQEILKTHGYGIGRLETETARVRDNLYLATCDSQTLSYYEQLLGLPGNRGLPLEERRILVITKYGMRPLHTLPVLKAMLETAVGAGNYFVECFYEKYRLTIKIIDQDLQKVKGVYDMAAEISPAHIELFLYAEYVGKCEMSLRAETAVKFIADFYPRFNLPHLKLDRTWKLNGNRKLSGYNSRETVDLYPVLARFKTAVKEAPNEGTRLHLQSGAGEREWIRNLTGILTRTFAAYGVASGQRMTVRMAAAEAWEERTRFRLSEWAQEKAEVGERLRVSVSVLCKAVPRERQIVRTSVVNTVEAGEIRVYNKNRLDGRFQLNGGRKLNGGTELR